MYQYIMDIIRIEIEPMTRTVLINEAIIWVRQLKLFEYAMIEVRLLDNFDKIWDIYTYKIDQEDYKNWTNDQYLIDWVKNKLSNEKQFSVKLRKT